MEVDIEQFRNDALAHKDMTTKEIDDYLKLMEDMKISQKDMHDVIKTVIEMNDHIIKEYERFSEEVLKL